MPRDWHDYQQGIKEQRWSIVWQVFAVRAKVFLAFVLGLMVAVPLAVAAYTRLPTRGQDVVSAIGSIGAAILGACVLVWFGVVFVIFPLQEGIGVGRNAFDSLWRLLVFAAVVYIYWLLARRYSPRIWRQIMRAVSVLVGR